MRLNVDLITERRYAANLSRPMLAARLGHSSMTILALEKGTNHEYLTLGFLDRLAEELGIRLPNLLQEADESIPAARDDLVAEAALAQIGHVHPQDLASAVGWQLPRARTAFQQLQRRRSGTAIHVGRSRGGYRLGPHAGILTNAQVRTLERLCIRRAGMTMADFRLLKAAVDGRIDGPWLRKPKHDGRIVLARLMRLGWVEPVTGGIRVTPEVAFSLRGRRSDRGITSQERCSTSGSGRRLSG